MHSDNYYNLKYIYLPLFSVFSVDGYCDKPECVITWYKYTGLSEWTETPP